MAFASIFIPNFMMQAVMRSEPALRDRAVALLDGTPPVWSVAALNEAAARAGIATGMTKSQAQLYGQFCGIEIRHRSIAREKGTHAALLDLGWSLSPRVEDTAPDTIVLDLAGLNSLFGSDENIASQLAERASGLGLLAQIAAASRVEAAIIAARGFAGITVIPEGAEPEILGSLPVNALSPSLEVLETLECWGVRTCAALAALPVLQLSERLGQEGVRLHELAQGRSERSMVLAGPALHFEEELELEDAVEELEPLSFLLGRLLGQLCARLSARSLAACGVRVRFELDPGFEMEVRNVNRPSGITAPRFPRIYERVLTLPVPMRDSKTLLNLLRLHLQSDPPSAPIVKIILAADAARPRVAQGGLFLPSFPDPEKLELTIARLASVVGDSNVGSPELIDTHRPGELRMRRFAAVNADEARLRGQRKQDFRHSVAGRRSAREAKDGAARAGLPAANHATPGTGFRVFRPALPAKVDFHRGRPSHVRFQGVSGHVVTVSGPWRSSGDWWREDGWQNDEWDLEIVFSSTLETRMKVAFVSKVSDGAAAPDSASNTTHGFYRIFFDLIRQEWFVRGAYD